MMMMKYTYIILEALVWSQQISHTSPLFKPQLYRVAVRTSISEKEKMIMIKKNEDRTNKSRKRKRKIKPLRKKKGIYFS